MTEQGSNAVSVIDTPSNTITSTISGLSQPWGAAARGDQSLVYVVSLNGGSSPGYVSVIDTATNTLTGSNIAVGNGPTAIALTPNGAAAYVTNENNNTVSVINTATNTVSATIPVGINPFFVAISPDGATAYVSNNSYTSPSNGSVSVISTATNTVIATINLGSNDPAALAVSPDGSRLYVTNTGNVTVINTATNAVTGTIAIAHSAGMTFSPNGATAYVLNGNSVAVVNTATNAVSTTIALGTSATETAISPDGTTLYVTELNNNTIAVISTATNTVTATVAAGNQPLFPATCSSGNALLVGRSVFKANSSATLGCTLASGATGASGPVFTGGTLRFAGANIASSLPVTLMSEGGVFDTAGNNAALSGTISGSGGLTKIGLGTLTLSGSGSYSGSTTVNAGTLQAGIANALSAPSAYTIANGATLDLNGFDQTIGSLAGAGTVTFGSATLTTGNDNSNTTFSGALSGSGGLTKIGTGIFVLSGINAYTGATAINGGMLEVDGSIASSSSVTVNSGGRLSGTGIVDPSVTTIMSGGVLAPGNAADTTGKLTVTGNLAFQSGALYLVQVTPSAAARTSITGTASLAGTVSAVFAPGSYVARQYTILQSAGLNGSTFSGLSNTNLPAGFTDSLSYSANDAFLNLTAGLGIGTPLNQNQQNVATAINTYFNNGGALPPAFVTIFGLTGPALQDALMRLHGEDASGAEHGAFNLMNEFLGLMLDPFVDGRSNAGSGSSALGFAPDRQAGVSPEMALAYARVFKEPPPQPFAQRWTVWASGFAGSATANGVSAAGSNTVSTSTYGYAGGMDYHLSPDTVLGFALSGGGTNWGLANALGTGRSDALLAGIDGVAHRGPAYVAAALSFADHWFTTSRAAFAGDQLAARFQGQSYAGRLEGGYRFAVPFANAAAGVTPYAAIQMQVFHTPAFSETDRTGGGFGLSYSAMNGTDARSEIGGRFDDPTRLGTMPLILRAKVAWAHDWASNPALNTSFASLPGTSFTVNGAPIPHDSALTSAGAQLFLAPSWSLLAKFDGEFASGSQRYAGSGRLLYTW